MGRRRQSQGPFIILAIALAGLLGLTNSAWARDLIREDAPVYAYAFNVGSEDVTIIDTASNEVVETRPLGAGVRWLSNEQNFWDGNLIWTYDLVEGRVHVIGIEPMQMRVEHQIDIGRGPAHSVQLTPDHRHILANAAGDDLLAVIDRERLEIIESVGTGLFPCDIDLSPDGTVAYFPERDQDTVAVLDLEQYEIVQRTSFPEGSLPHMLRVDPDRTLIWVQTAAAGTNNILDPETLEIVTTHQLGSVPVSNAWTPDGRYSYVTHLEDDFIAIIDAETHQEVTRVRVGSRVGNVGFRPDGAYAYVTVIGEDKVAVIDTSDMEVVKEIPTGSQPWGLVIMSP